MRRRGYITTGIGITIRGLGDISALIRLGWRGDLIRMRMFAVILCGSPTYSAHRIAAAARLPYLSPVGCVSCRETPAIAPALARVKTVDPVIQGRGKDYGIARSVVMMTMIANERQLTGS